MTNTELINAYLDNELTETDRMNFEKRLEGDSQLQQELALQKDVIEGIRLARKAQLKQMLNNVPVAQTTIWSAGKIATIVAAAAIVVMGVMYFTSEETTPETEPVTNEMPSQEAEQNMQPQDSPAEEEPVAAEDNTEATEESEVAINKVEEVVEAQPEDKRPVVAPSFDRAEADRTEVVAPDGKILGEISETPTETDVVIERVNENYKFHYMFEPGMLKLYGNFNNELYQILEFNSADGRVWFLEYENKYYFLDDSSTEIRPLKEVKDEKLLNILTNIE